MVEAPVVQSTHRRAALVLAVSTSAIAAFVAAVLGTRFSQPAYIMPIWVVVVAAICVVPTVIGGAVAVRRGRAAAWLAPALISLLAIATLELFVFVIPIALILLLLFVVRARRLASTRGPGEHGAGIPGLLLTIGLVPLFLLIFLGSPVVACTTDGESNASPIWAWFGSDGSFLSSESGSSSGSSDSGVSTGTETVGATTYSWVCNGSTVVLFTTRR